MPMAENDGACRHRSCSRVCEPMTRTVATDGWQWYAGQHMFITWERGSASMLFASQTLQQYL